MVKKLNIAIIVLASLSLVIYLAFGFGLSVLKQAVDENGGFGALASITNSASNNNSSINNGGQIDLNNSNTLNTTSIPDGDLAGIYNAAYSFLVVYCVVLFLLVVTIIVLSSLLIKFYKDKHRENLSRNLNIWIIVISVLVFNIFILILSIISLVSILKTKK